MGAQTPQTDTGRRTVWIAAILSAGVHILAAGALGLERAVGLKGVTAEMDPQPPEPSEADNQVTPGIDNGRRLAVAWLGFEDPTEHTAPRSTTEQAALTPDPGGLVAPADVTSPTPEPPAPETPPQPQPPDPLVVERLRELEIRGIMGGTRILIFDTASGKSRAYEAGDALEGSLGIVLESVDKETITFRDYSGRLHTKSL